MVEWLGFSAKGSLPAGNSVNGWSPADITGKWPWRQQLKAKTRPGCGTGGGHSLSRERMAPLLQGGWPVAPSLSEHLPWCDLLRSLGTSFSHTLQAVSHREW